MPAFVVGPRWDILVWNRATSLLFGDLDVMSEEQRNVLWLVFSHSALAAMSEDWDVQARATLAQFRLSWARHLDQPRFVELVESLSAHSFQLAAWWAQHDVRPRLSRRRSYAHPIAGGSSSSCTSFASTIRPSSASCVHPVPRRVPPSDCASSSSRSRPGCWPYSAPHRRPLCHQPCSRNHCHRRGRTVSGG